MTLLDGAPEVAAQWHPTKNSDVTPADIASQTHAKFWWQCDAGPDHEWEASPNTRVVGIGSGCPYCSGRKVSVTNSLATIKPSAAAQWDVDRNECGPEDVVAGSKKKYWFKLGEMSVQRSLVSFKREDGDDDLVASLTKSCLDLMNFLELDEENKKK
jgi:hypothetical protein